MRTFALVGLRVSGAEIGVLISLEPATKPMEKEAASAGFYDSPFGRKYPRLQLVTVGELLAGKEIEYPRTLDVTFKKAPRARGAAAKSLGLPLGDEDEVF